MLIDGAESKEPRQVAAARRILQAVTGGRILLTQQGERKPQRGWLCGTFSVHALNAVIDVLDLPEGEEPPTSEISLDFRRPGEAEQLADEAKALQYEGMLLKEVAQVLSQRHGRPIGRNFVAAALRHWYKAHGLALPDGRSRRSQLARTQMMPTKAQDPAIMDPVVAMCNAGELYGGIAEQAKLDRNTMTKIVRHWHQQHGRAVPDGHTRRKSL